MDKSPAIHDLEGRDVEFPENTRERGSCTTTAATAHGGRERILLSIMGSESIVYHAVIALPSSYLEAKAMAIDSFHHQITSTGIPIQDLVLKLGIKSLSGQIAWAPLRPDQWANIICNGDEIRLGGSGAEFETDIAVTFVMFSTDGSRYGSRTIILPRTLQDLNKFMQKTLGVPKEFKLTTYIPGDNARTTIPYHQSLYVIRQMARQRQLGRIEVEDI